MTKVYLSSTLLDLREERQAVTDWLIGADFQPVHSYVANSETMRESCLEDIAGCDFLVLIVGHRYGHQPKNGNPENLSITCMEFRQARQLDLPCLAFLRTSVPDIGLSDVNDSPRLTLVHAFRKEVADTVRPAEFQDLTGFVAAFSAAILRHVTKLLKQRDANAPLHEQRIGELEAELQATRESALSRVLADAEHPQADDLAQRARAALLKGDTRLAEALLREQEERAANAAGENLREAALLAREIASLAIGRDSTAALSALERAARYLPGDYRAHGELGDALVVVGQTDTALLRYRTALAIGEALAARDPANTIWQRDLSVSHDKIGSVLIAHGDGPGALAAFRTSLAIRESLAAHDPANTQWQRDLSVSHNRIGDVLIDQADGLGALAAFRQSLSIRESFAAHDPTDTEWQRDLSVSHVKIGDVLLDQGDGPGALAAFRQSLSIRESLAARDPANTQWQRDISVSHSKIGDVLLDQGDGPGALAALRHSLAIQESLSARDPANTQWQRDLSVSHNKIGDVLIAQGDGPGALAALRQSLAIHESLAARNPANAEWQRDLIVSHVKLSEVTRDKTYAQQALRIATAMQARGTLAPRDTWMIADLKKKAGE